jgi:hypothetical protein
MRLILLAAAPLAIAACTASSPKSLACSTENAVYKLRGQPGAELRLLKAPHPLNAYTDLAAKVSVDGGTYWFTFTSSNGYSRDYMISTADPFVEPKDEESAEAETEDDESGEADLSEFHAFDAAYNVIEGSPHSGQPTPAHILAPGVGSAIWYSIPRRELNRSVWDLSDCTETAGAR